MSDQLAALTEINLTDLAGAVGSGEHPRLAHLARLVFHRAAGSFARQMLEFDAKAGESGLVQAARLAARQHMRELTVFGRDRLPTGAFLALSNHPGLADTLALFTALRRDDLKVIALDRPFLLSLPNVSRHLVYLTEDTQARVALVRQVAGHLRSGGAILTFPAGHVEPDPDTYPGAMESLRTWTDSARVFLRLSTGTAVVPVCVRGVAWPATANSLLTRIRRASDDRQLLASAMQLLATVMLAVRPVKVRIQIGDPIHAKDLATGEPVDVHRAVLEEMQRLIMNPPGEEGERVL